MLNVKNFYAYYGLEPAALQHAEIGQFEVYAEKNQVVVIHGDYHTDPFQWLSMGMEAIVFYTKSQRLAILILFDTEDEDETEVAVTQINRLVGIVQ